ncbi:MAG TPA: hypothetical protein VM012_15065 [Flavitalea sp.]|nr:hypothetical protein [Flavitalea sp.]
MSKKTISISCIVVGSAALIIAAMRFINGDSSMQNLVEILIYSISGCILLFYGIHVVYELKGHQGHNPASSTSNKAAAQRIQPLAGNLYSKPVFEQDSTLV